MHAEGRGKGVTSARLMNRTRKPSGSGGPAPEACRRPAKKNGMQGKGDGTEKGVWLEPQDGPRGLGRHGRRHRSKGRGWPSSSMLPLTVFWRSRSALRGAVEIASVAGIAAYVVPNTGPAPDCTYTDGSRLGSPPASGASAVLPNGRIVLCRIPGNPNSYRAEVIGILLGSYFSPPPRTLTSGLQGSHGLHDWIQTPSATLEVGVTSQTITRLQEPVC